ncbi:MAG: hypothetical protein GEU86_00570 [Actinophytocola sp.]|nr:hypothetical protein [Actinophytocola sp.]
MTETSSLAVELAEGFADDEVAVLVDGEQVWHRTGVTTNYSVGLADVVHLPPPPHEATVEVRVRGKADTQRVDATSAAGEIRLRARLDPAGSLALAEATEETRY